MAVIATNRFALDAKPKQVEIDIDKIPVRVEYMFKVTYLTVKKKTKAEKDVTVHIRPRRGDTINDALQIAEGFLKKGQTRLYTEKVSEKEFFPSKAN